VHSESEQIYGLIDVLSNALRGVVAGRPLLERIKEVATGLGRCGVFVMSNVRDRQITTQTLNDGTEESHVQLTLDVTYQAPDGSTLATTAIGRGCGSVQDATFSALDDAHWIALSTTLRLTDRDLASF
jgi:hypothetical protein